MDKTLFYFIILGLKKKNKIRDAKIGKMRTLVNQGVITKWNEHLGRLFGKNGYKYTDKKSRVEADAVRLFTMHQNWSCLLLL